MKGKITIEWIAIFLVTIAIAVGMIYYTHGHVEDLPTNLPKDKETLIRLYACSLALCTHGCGSVQVDKICLYNDTLTHKCVGIPNTNYKWCQDFCDDPPGGWPPYTTAWTNAGVVCGKNYSLSLPLTGDAHFNCKADIDAIGCREGQGGSDIYHLEFLESLPYPYHERYFESFYNKLVRNEGLPQIIKRKGRDDGITILGENCINNLQGPPGGTRSLKEFFPGQLRIYGDTIGNPGYIYLTGGGGLGHIFLDSTQAYEKYGCLGGCYLYNAPVIPCAPNDIRYSFDRCKIYGNLVMWSIWKNGDCADVFFNSTLGAPPKFTLDVHRSDGMKACISRPSDNKCEFAYLGAPANFDADITNELGTGSTFTLSVKEYEHDGTLNDGTLGVVSFTPNGANFNVGDGETGTSVIGVTPTEVGEYKIWVLAEKPDRYDSQLDMVTLIVADFNVYFLPPEHIYLARDESGTFNIQISDGSGEQKDFILGYTCTNSTGGTCACVNSAGQPFGGTVLNVNNFGSTTISCSSPFSGDYNIIVSATADGRTKSSTQCNNPCIKSGKLHVRKCKGTLDLTLSPSSVNFGQAFITMISGVSGCDEKTVRFNINNVFDLGTSVNWNSDGSSLTSSYDADFLPDGTHRIYAYLDINGDGDTSDTGETDSADLSVSAIFSNPYSGWYQVTVDWEYDDIIDYWYFNPPDCGPGDCNAVGDCVDFDGCIDGNFGPSSGCPSSCGYVTTGTRIEKCQIGNVECTGRDIFAYADGCSYPSFDWGLPNCIGCQADHTYCSLNISACTEYGWECKTEDSILDRMLFCDCNTGCGAHGNCNDRSPYTFYDTNSDGSYDIYCAGDCQSRP